MSLGISLTSKRWPQTKPLKAGLIASTTMSSSSITKTVIKVRMATKRR
jgi:hypothetical protein